MGAARGSSSEGDDSGSGGVGSFLSVHWSGDIDMEDTRLWVQACVKNGHKGSMRLLSRLAIYLQLTSFEMQSLFCLSSKLQKRRKRYKCYAFYLKDLKCAFLLFCSDIMTNSAFELVHFKSPLEVVFFGARLVKI